MLMDTSAHSGATAKPCQNCDVELRRLKAEVSRLESEVRRLNDECNALDEEANRLSAALRLARQNVHDDEHHHVARQVAMLGGEG